jgi:hypothetical protein
VTVLCFVCGTRPAENPTVHRPTCHACRQAIWERSHRTPAELDALRERARARLMAAVVIVRRVQAARFGLDSLTPFTPLKS